MVRDGEGRLAAATSTGGVFNKRHGRVGDTPIPGAGTWADDLVAVSCTGVGEFYIRTAAAAQVAFRMRFAGQDLAAAAQATLDDLKLMRAFSPLAVQVKAAGGVRSFETLMAVRDVGVTRVGATATKAILEDAKAKLGL